MALLVNDIDRFKTFNDSLGYGIGNELLISIARRLSEFVRETDTISRQGGDEFLLLLPGLDSANSCVRFIDKLMRELALPITLSGQEISLSASVGIALYPQDGANFETLLKKADMAMYRAKSGGRNTNRFFNEQINEGAIIQMAHNLGLRTIAEGVETAAVLEQLQAYGCDEVQGYYLAKPMPADAFMLYLQQHIRQS